MAGKLVKVSDGFDRYLLAVQKKLQEDTGKRFSRKDITAIIAAQPPVIKIEMNGKRKKMGSLFDF